MKAVIKKCTVVIIICASVFLISSCSTKSADTKPHKPKIGMLFSYGGIKGDPFNRSGYEGYMRACEDFDLEPLCMDVKTESEFDMVLEALLDEGCDLVVAMTEYSTEAVIKAAPYYPDRTMVIIEGNHDELPPNVGGVTFDIAEAAYLGGCVAALMSDTGMVGLEMAFPTPLLARFGHGFIAGVKDTKPETEVIQACCYSYNDSVTAKADAQMMIVEGADVLFAVAGSSGYGTIEACREAGVSAIGVDVDQHDVAEGKVITSVVKRIDNVVYSICRDFIAGTFEPGSEVYGLKEGAVGLAPATKYLPGDVLAQVRAVERELIEGKRVIPRTTEEFDQKYGDIFRYD